MKIINSLTSITKPFRNAVISIGNFDGVHLGHQALFHTVVEKADEIDGTAIAMTFEPHPMRVLKTNTQPPLITLYEQKAELIERTGIDILICVPFNREFAALSARAFIEDILVKQIGIKAVVVGQDYSFGKNREGNLDKLRAFASQFDFEVIVPDWIQSSLQKRDRISSTRIRQLVMEGSIERAEKLLGRHYQIRGEVVHGRNRGGKLLGFPTANINLQDELCPLSGIYAVTVELDGNTLRGVANIGYSPTFDDHVFTVEVHLIEFNQDIYGQKIKVNFIKRIRDEKKFDSLEALSNQIKRDVAAAAEILANMT